MQESRAQHHFACILCWQTRADTLVRPLLRFSCGGLGRVSVLRRVSGFFCNGEIGAPPPRQSSLYCRYDGTTARPGLVLPAAELDQRVEVGRHQKEHVHTMRLDEGEKDGFTRLHCSVCDSWLQVL